ncbi:MAG TPA: Stk1 family PASTA domain-containing Ser/Thr kinase [Chloroflexota bacterium]|nr:Stk1 family PASTA domain-containing Ser/Thr kinase [Chloroflexota bacterium]
MTGRLAPPVVLDGRYELGDLIAEGGMAQVRHGRDLKLKRDVAIKILRAQFAASPEFLDRFHREAELAAQLSHPYLVNVFDVGQEGDTHFIVMELLPGRTLKDLVADGPLPLERAVELTREVALGMAFAHQRGLVHRDLKPQNILLSTTGHAKVADFGLAQAGESAQLTQPGTVWGTVQYISPEQAQGLPADARSDVYALGAILYELLTGQTPYDGATPASIMMKHVYDPPPDAALGNPAVPAAAARVAQRAMAKAPADRFATMDALAVALADVRDAAIAETAAWSVAPRTRPGGTAPSPATPRDDVTRVISSPAGPTVVRPTPAPVGRPSVAPRRPTRQRNRRAPLLLAGGLLLFFALMALGGLMARQLVGGAAAPRATATVRPAGSPTAQPPTPSPTAVMLAVPNVLGQPVATAQARLATVGLSSETVEDFNRDVAAGLVAAQEPNANAQLEQGKTVKLTVSRGPQRVAVPNVVGMSFRDANGELTRAGFTVKRQEGYNSRPVETVYEQRPAAAEQAVPGSEITLLVSLGRDLVAVPQLRGLTEEAARQRLTALGLQTTVQSVLDSSVQVGQVSTQSPPPNEQVDRGSTVIVGVVRPGAVTATSVPATPTPRPAATATAVAPTATLRTNAGGQAPPGQQGR